MTDTKQSPKVPVLGAMTKKMVKHHLRQGNWDVLAVYFNFAPRFIRGLSGRAIFDWASCPPDMTAILQQPDDSAKVRGGGSDRHVTFVNQGQRCHYCGSLTEFRRWTIDHKEPRRFWKVFNSPQNKVGACTACNHAKSDMSYEEFLQTDYLSNARRSELGAADAPSLKYKEAKKSNGHRGPHSLRL